MNKITYDLEEGNYNNQIREFAQEVVAKVEEDHAKLITDYMNFIEQKNIEKLRSRNEYIFEFLSLGVLANLYLNDVLATSKASYSFMSKLIEWKEKHNKLESIIKLVQKFLNTVLLHSVQREDYSYEFINKRDVTELIKWLEATDEYQEEVKRFQNWLNYFANNLSVKVSYDLKGALTLAAWFQKQSRQRLSKYTKSVKRFVQGEQSKHLWRTDILLRTKPELEYHLNMLGAEIIDRAQQNKFLETAEKVLLVPTCMRNRAKGECRAKKTEVGLQCTHCERDCNINLLDGLGKQSGFEVVIINHSQKFSDYFRQWSQQDQTGLVVITCALNLLLADYQLRRFNIPGQVLLLDYCGCKMHWSEEGLITKVDLDRLLTKMQQDPQDKFIQLNIFEEK